MPRSFFVLSEDESTVYGRAPGIRRGDRKKLSGSSVKSKACCAVSQGPLSSAPVEPGLCRIASSLDIIKGAVILLKD